MKSIFTVLLIALAPNAFGGTLIVQTVGSSGGFGSELKYYNLEDRSGAKYLYLQNKMDEACRIPIQLLKDLGIDPLQAGHLLLNSHDAAPVIECNVPREEMGKTRIAHDISFTSFPKP